METFGKFLSVLMILILSPIISGFVLVKLWGWFVVTTFNAPPLRLVEAIGLTIVWSYLTMKIGKNEEESDTLKSLGAKFVVVILQAAFALLIGWIVSMFY